MPLSTILQLYHGGQFGGGPGEKPPTAESHWQTLSHNVVSSTPHLTGIQTHNISGDKHWLHR